MISIEEFVSQQMNERYKGCIICGSGLTGKTMLVQKVAKENNGFYFDVLQKISQNEDLKKKIYGISPEKIMKLIDIKDQKLIIVDHMDIVFSIWTESKQREFIRRLDKKSHGPCLVVVLHNYKILQETDLMENNSYGNKRILNIAELS